MGSPMKLHRKRTLPALLALVAVAVLWATYSVVEAPAVEVLGDGPLSPTKPVAIVSHRWQVEIAQSNHVTIRPGSLYDIVTYFEQNLGWPNPRFNYLFLDTGLGTADPIYPVFQRGRQASWGQLLPGMLSESNRHIDHAATLETPEGCRIQSTYWVRHIDEFPDLYHRQRAAGYTLVDISFNYYTRLKPGAECGRHRVHDPDPSFDPMAYAAQFADTFRSFDDVPAEMLARYEAKIGLLKLVSEEFDREKWPRFKDVYTFEGNSLWYYPDSVEEGYGLDEPRPQPGFPELARARQLLFPATPRLEAELSLARVLPAAAFEQTLRFLDGEPVPGYDPRDEPGGDVLSLDQLSDENFYTSGLEVIPIGDVRADVGDPSHYRLVSVLARPYQMESDRRFAEPELVPQVRFVYQLTDPRVAGRPLEQLYLHLNYDAVDRTAPPAARELQHRELLAELERVAALREEGDPGWEAALTALVERTVERPVHQVSFSSTLTGIWVFGALSRAFNDRRDLEAMRVVREGVDVGYYSTAYDTVLFREALAASTGERRQRLAEHLDALTPRSYRDPRRSDPHAISFERMTCAQCHQMAGRDAVHVALNDGLDRRFTAPFRATEFVYRELDRQLAFGQRYWGEAR